MKKFIKDITGITKKEKELEEQEMALLKKKDPKEYATRRKEPWVNVLDVKVNEDNVRNGFFELDWNKYFIAQLVEAGYGVDNDPEEEIVDRWFQTLCRTIGNEQGIDVTGSGYVQINRRDDGKTEVS